MIEKTTATDRFKEYLKDANHFELEDAWKLFKEAGREHYTYKKQEKFLVSLFLNSHNDNLYKMLNSRKFFSGYEVYKTVNFIYDKIKLLKNDKKHIDKFKLGFEHLKKEPQLFYHIYISFLVSDKKDSEKIIQFKKDILNEYTNEDYNVNSFNGLSLNERKDILYSYTISPELNKWKSLFSAGVKLNSAYLQASYIFEKETYLEVVKYFISNDCDFSQILGSVHKSKEDYDNRELKKEYNLKGILLEKYPELFFSDLNDLIPGETFNPNIYSISDNNYTEYRNISNPVKMFKIFMDNKKTDFNLSLSNDSTLLSQTFEYLHKMNQSYSNSYSYNAGNGFRVLNEKLSHYDDINVNFLIENLHPFTFCMKYKMFDLGFTIIKNDFDPNFSINDFKKLGFHYYHNDHVIFNKYTIEALPKFKEEYQKLFFDTIIQKGIKFQISIDDINEFTKIKHFNQSFVSLINKFVSNPPEEIYVYFLLSSVLKEQNSLIDKVRFLESTKDNHFICKILNDVKIQLNKLNFYEKKFKNKVFEDHLTLLLANKENIILKEELKTNNSKLNRRL